jgi:hypothetical protein
MGQYKDRAHGGSFVSLKNCCNLSIFLKLFKWEWTEKKKEKVSLIYVNSDEQ